MKRLVSLWIIGGAMALSGCGGSSKPVPPPTGGFSVASLKGQYGFSMSGLDLSGAYLARAGSFAADGNGKITAALEDVVDLGATPTASTIAFTGGTYEIQANGRGVMTLQNPNGGGLQLNFILNSTTQGELIQTDLIAAATGQFNLQTPGNFTAAAVSGSYVFDLSGVSFSSTNTVAPITTIGQMAADGNGNITSGTIDVKDGNTDTASGAMALTPGTYQMDLTNGNGSNFGRGTMAFNGHTFVFYIVNSGRVLLLEEDALGGSQGSAVQQSGTIPTANAGFTGSFVYMVDGSSVLGSHGELARVARFTADGQGGISAISLDDNNNGAINHIAPGTNEANATYEIDTAHAGSGRGTFTFKDSSLGTFTNVFYLVSPSQGVVQDISPGLITVGPMLAQSGSPFTNANLAGNYALSWNGVQLGVSVTTSIPFEEDLVGQYVLSNATSNNISGTVDYTELGLSNSTFLSDISVSGSLKITGDGTSRNSVEVVTGGSSSTTFDFEGYVVNSNTMFIVSTDSSRVVAGVAIQQMQ
ncbi:MAG TPA: hypothetical protein VGF61_22055 [Candidatus Acidoferrum sp.]|jgi:hypothetical protein